jgi:hypothetical protein
LQHPKKKIRNRIPTFLKIRKRKTDGGRNSQRKIATLRHDSHLFLPADQQAQTGSVSATACVTCIGIQERKEEEEEIEKNRAAKALLDQMKLPATANRILTGTL